MRYPNWTTKDGRKIPINKMSDQHLCNALRMLKRASEFNREQEINACGSAMCFLQGEMATYYAEQEFDRLCEESWNEFVPPIFEKMEELARKRGLEWE